MNTTMKSWACWQLREAFWESHRPWRKNRRRPRRSAKSVHRTRERNLLAAKRAESHLGTLRKYPQNGDQPGSGRRRINEGSGRIGVASLTTDLMKEGTEKLTAQQVAESAARMGSTLEVHAGKDQTKLGIDVLQEFAPDAVKLLADVAQHPRLPQSEIERLKNDALRQIALQNSQPQTIALARFRKLLYGDHPYATVGAGRSRHQETDHPGCEGFLRGKLRRAAGASLRCRKIRCGRGEESHCGKFHQLEQGPRAHGKCSGAEAAARSGRD